jgi:Zinc finger, C2H2 type
MQKVAAAGMGNPKERKECPICGKTLYDRSTWNRHMRIHTGKLHRFNGFVKKSDNVWAVDSTKYT